MRTSGNSVTVTRKKDNRKNGKSKHKRHEFDLLVGSAWCAWVKNEEVYSSLWHREMEVSGKIAAKDTTIQ